MLYKVPGTNLTLDTQPGGANWQARIYIQRLGQTPFPILLHEVHGLIIQLQLAEKELIKNDHNRNT